MQIRQAAIFIFFLFSFNSFTIGQRNLTKDEIYNYWAKTDNTNKQDSLVVRFNRKTNYVVNKIIDSLYNLKVDSIIVYSVSYPGYTGKSNCINGSYPHYTYIIWKTGAQSIIKKMEGNCVANNQIINSIALFDFYNTHQKKIENDYIMPAIYSGQVDTNKIYCFTQTVVYHEPKYFLYFSFGKNHKAIEFSENDIEDKQSLFHNDNSNSGIYNWWQVIKSQTTK